MVEVNFEDPVFAEFLFCSGILVAKTLLIVFFTDHARYTKKVVLNPEDIPMVEKYAGMKNAVCKYNDAYVEKARRTHWNDVVNIPLFIFVGIAYVLSKPDPSIALNVFKTYMWCRIFYSVSCVLLLPRSTRDIACVVGYLLTIYMALVGAVKFF